MAIDDLLAALEREAEAEVRRRIGEAEREATDILARAREGVEDRLARALGDRESELRAAFERERVEVRRRARTRVLETRERFLNRVFEAARGRLDLALEDPAYEDALDGILRQGLACFGERSVVIGCAPALENRIDRWGDREGVRVEPDPSLAIGVQLRALDGSLVVDGTLDDALRRRRRALQIEIIAGLGEEIDGPLG